MTDDATTLAKIATRWREYHELSYELANFSTVLAIAERALACVPAPTLETTAIRTRMQVRHFDCIVEPVHNERPSVPIPMRALVASEQDITDACDLAEQRERERDEARAELNQCVGDLVVAERDRDDIEQSYAASEGRVVALESRADKAEARVRELEAERIFATTPEGRHEQANKYRGRIAELEAALRATKMP